MSVCPIVQFIDIWIDKRQAALELNNHISIFSPNRCSFVNCHILEKEVS